MLGGRFPIYCFGWCSANIRASFHNNMNRRDKSFLATFGLSPWDHAQEKERDFFSKLLRPQEEAPSTALLALLLSSGMLQVA